MEQKSEVKKKKPFFNLSSNEWVNDSVTHFMKSGNVLRAKENDRLTSIAQHIPKEVNGVKVEYDINYGSPRGTITGYKFTDLLTQVIYLAPCNSEIATQNMIDCIKKGPTDDGFRILDALRSNLQDKYMLDDDLDGDYDNVDQLVLLPGTNLITKDAVDFNKVDEMYNSGAWVKIHPITAKVWQTMLENKYKGRIIKSDAALYPILKKANKVHFTLDNKEAKGVAKTFHAIYNGLDQCGVKDKLVNRFAALLSHPESGIITVHHNDKQDAINRFFTNMSKHKHVPPKFERVEV
jgi:hypothetical protein